MVPLLGTTAPNTHGPLNHLTFAGSSSVSPQEVAALLAKEQLNSYGIMAPLRPRGERRLRGGAIYPRCAMVNHECAPNAARFDAFDQAFDQQQQMQQAGALGAAAAAACTAAQIRAMHDLPPGTEVTISYVPLNWDLEARQEHLQQVRGGVGALHLLGLCSFGCKGSFLLSLCHDGKLPWA